MGISTNGLVHPFDHDLKGIEYLLDEITVDPSIPVPIHMTLSCAHIPLKIEPPLTPA